jgi:hypothetical protein
VIVFQPTELKTSRRFFREPVAAHLVASVREMPGVKYEAGQLLFDRSLHTEESVRLLMSHLKGEQLRVQFQGVGKRVQVTEADVALINERHSQVELTIEDLVVFEDYAANDVRTRRPLRFTQAYLKAIVPSYEQGRTFLLHHRETFPVGATFAAKVTKATVRGIDANWLVIRSYAVIKGASPERLQHIQDMQTGVLRYASIEARGGNWQFMEVELPDGTHDYFYEIDASADAEGGELSRVYLGAMYGAGDNKLDAGTPEMTTPTKKSEDVICVMY